MNEDQKQVIIGSLLGKAHICNIVKSPYLQMKFNKQNFDWLKIKSKELEFLSVPNYPKVVGNICIWKSKCSHIWSDFYKSHYQDNKKIVTLDSLNQLKSLGLAVLYGDCGYLTGRDFSNAALRVSRFDILSIECFEQYLNEVGIPCNKNKIGNSFNIVFSRKGTLTLWKIILRHLPRSSYFKIAGKDLIG